MNTTTKAVADVLTERRRQTEIEGWTPAHDDEHRDGSLATAAACYAHPRGLGGVYEVPQRPVPLDWPWEVAAWRPKDRRRNLVRAAALLLAEIERIDRADVASRHSAAAPWIA